MRSRLTTQLGWRPIRKHRKWIEPSEVEARLQRDMEDWGMNHDSETIKKTAVFEFHRSLLVKYFIDFPEKHTIVRFLSDFLSNHNSSFGW